MNELAVVVIGIDEEQRSILQMQVDGTGVARTLQMLSSFPIGATDPGVRRIRDAKPELLVIDIPRQDAGPALRAIELFSSELPNTGIFAVGETSQPQTIIAAMRSGAREFLEKPTSTTHLLDAMLRLTTSRAKKETQEHGKIYTVVNAKGGSGATTIAVNLAVALQRLQGSSALVDLAPLGHASLHLNVRPQFTIVDAIRNAHRLDPTLLEGYMTQSESGLHLLAGAPEPMSDEFASTDLARFFDVLVNRFRHVVVDASSRLDRSTRLVADLSESIMLVTTADVAGLWSAERVRNYLGEGSCRERIGLVLNRFKKISGMSDREIQSTTRTKILFKLANQYVPVADSINRGIPVTTTNHTDLARSFMTLAGVLTADKAQVAHKSFSLFS